MHVIRATQQMLETRTLVIGFQGENLRTQLRIDCAATFAEYPNATPALAVKPSSGETYPVFVERDGNEVVWDIVANNLVLKGDGELQLTFYKDNVIAKTVIGTIRVNRSLQIDGEMPDVVATWIENANRKLAEVDAQIVELEGMVDTATDAATRAEQSASTASTKAEQAAGSAATATEKATEATNAAGTATAKAAEAEQSAQTATNKANAAAESERIATAKAGDATTAAGTATAKAEQATEAAQTATEKARDASASATAAHASEINAAESADGAFSAEVGANAAKRAAETSATQAGISEQNAGIAAQTATQKAAEATQSATNAEIFAGTATTKAEEAAESAQAASDAQTAVEQTAEQLADSLEQIEQNTQDIADLDERKANIDGYYPDMTVGNAEQLNSSKYVENSEPYTLRTSGGTSDIGNREYVDAVVGGTLAWNQAVRDEASENSTDFADIVTVTDAVEDAAGVKVKIEPVQDLHGYDHPWPAGGGKNLFDVSQVPSLTYQSGASLTNNDDGSLTVSTSSSDGSVPSRRILSELAPNLVVGETYTMSLETTGTSKYFYLSKVGIAWISGKSYTITQDFLDSNVNFYASGVSTTAVVSNIQIEKGSTATAWSPYANICPISGWDGVQIVVSPTTDAEDGQTYDITLPTEAGTVYGGELTVNEDGTGRLVASYAITDLGDLYWGKDTSVNRFNSGGLVNTKQSDTTHAKAYCSMYKLLATGQTSQRITGFTIVSGGGLYIYDSTQEDATTAEFKTYVTGQYMCYPLATPITYTLTASQIRTLLGTNNVWADTGDLALTYTGTDEHLTLESGKKYLARISGTDSMLLGSGQEITAVKGTDNVFDLTQMFGTAVADYVYGQGASFFRKWFGKQWYPYNAGELLSVEGLQSHDMVGFNLFDESIFDTLSGITKVGGYWSGTVTSWIATSTYNAINDGLKFIGRVSYCISAHGRLSSGGTTDVRVRIYYTDGTTSESKNNSIAAGREGTTYIVSDSQKTIEGIGFTYGSNGTSSTFDLEWFCISLAHNGSRNGEYEPYEKHSYPLDSSVILRGIPKVGANGVYWDGDRYLPDGTVERRYGVVDLGTINWRYRTDTTFPVFVGTIAGSGTASTYEVGNITCSKYVATTSTNVSQSGYDKTIAKAALAGVIYVQDSSYTDAATFTAAMSGVYLVYELATPTTETAQPYHSTQWVSDWGTEEFVSTGIVPVGTETRYPANLRDKLQHLPDAASGNGSYLITQTDGQMVLTPFPAPPSSAGNYVLKATVTGGVATYTWEVAT